MSTQSSPIDTDSATPTPVALAPPWHVERWHGWTLVALGASIPVGEGLALGALGAVVLALGLRRREIDWSVLGRGATGTVLGAFGVWLAAGIVALAVGGEGWLKPGEVGRWAPLVAIPAIVLSARLVRRVTLERAALAFVAAMALASLFGILQYTFDVRPGESLWRSSGAVLSQALVPGQARSVAGGFFFHRLKLAHVLLVGIGPVLARQLFVRLSPRRRALELTLLAVLGTALLLTFARGAVVAVAAGAVALVPFAHRRTRRAAIAAMVVAAALALASPGVRQRIESIGSHDASAVRALIWSQAVRVIADHPFGAGLGNYSSIVGRYYDTSSPSFATRTYPHNLWLAAWAEAGPVGLAGFTGAFLAFVLACAGYLRRRGRAPAVAAAGLFGMVATLVVGTTHDVLFHNSVALAVAALMGFVLAAMEPAGAPAATSGAGSAAPPRVPAART